MLIPTLTLAIKLSQLQLELLWGDKRGGGGQGRNGKERGGETVPEQEWPPRGHEVPGKLTVLGRQEG